MKRLFKGFGHLINADCLDAMNEIESKSIDLILADLPYGITRNQWDSIIPLNLLWNHYERIIKDNGAIVLTAQQPFTSMLVMSNLNIFRYEWIWEKEKGTGFLNANKMPMKSHENILVFYKYLPTYNPQKEKGIPYKRIKENKEQSKSTNYGDFAPTNVNNKGDRYPKTTLFYESDGQKGNSLHPTQKPVALFEYLIKTYTNENDLVLDNTIGSGTTAIACIRNKRQFIGIEKETKYFNDACKRVENEITLQKSKLF